MKTTIQWKTITNIHTHIMAHIRYGYLQTAHPKYVFVHKRATFPLAKWK